MIGWDMVLLVRTKPPELTRHVEHTLPLGIWTRVKLRVSNTSNRRIGVAVHDFHPAGMPVSGLPFEATIEPESWYETTYKLRPLARGSFSFDRGQVLLASPYGWWRSSIRLGEQSDVRVYPNFQAVSKYGLLAGSNQLNQIGIHRMRKRGEGREFHQMRDYVLGDSLHQIDWKATSRKTKLISREFRDERDQQVIFLIDCGQSMRAQDGELSHFDHALNAVLLLANVALRHGDGTGVMTFSGPQRWLAPRKGRSQLNLMLNHLYDIQPGLETADFMGAATKVLTHVRKRSLVVLVTNLKDKDSGELATHATRVKVSATGEGSELPRQGGSEVQAGRRIVGTVTADVFRREGGDNNVA